MDRSFIGMILIGLLAGAVAKLLTPGKDPGGCIITILLGIGGSMLAGYLGSLMNWYQKGDIVGFIPSVIGAILILIIYRMIMGKRR